MTKSTQLVGKLQADKEEEQKNHGQRTALMGMLENELTEVKEENSDLSAKLEANKYDLSKKDDELQALQQQLEATEQQRAASEKAKKSASDALSQAQKGAAKKSTAVVDNLQREVQQLQQAMARKSSAAQKIIREREEESKQLRAENKRLKNEVDKGSLSDRKIFELAALQSNRESAQVTEIDARDKAIQRMQQKLVEQDGELATEETKRLQAEGQVEELCRVRRREDVNLDYLKSIVVQFLSKPPGSSERSSLLPVLATLLQFDDGDYQVIEDGKQKLSWFGSIVPTDIAAPLSGSS
uniref:GRIP domain-containing protein n=1 Tax=Craspedostauros australis TaxID=1486917 RepID=A0A7R9WNY7_9STRA|mmetsp:Transcript_13965/g.38379  ORF Transcript_13965/g.38379 Transcript_13965/m.38379 type:complete len:298 (+) Transcript_13965:3-896(+)